ncbi:hypothetical protein Tco_0145993 [Tanacetum coccineum]
MPTKLFLCFSKKPKAATADLHKDLLGTRNPGLGYIAKRAQPVLYDADTLLHPAHHPVRIWDSEDVLVHQVVSMKHDEMNNKTRTDVSNASNPATPVTPFVHNRPPPSQVLFHFQQVNAVFHQFEGIINERTTQKPLYVSEWCFDYAKQFVEQQLMRSLREVSEWMDSKAVENNAILKTELCGKRSRLDSTPSGENQVLASGMYNKTVQVRFTSKKRPLVWKATRNHNVNTTKTAWRPTGKVVGSVKPQWKPTGRHFALYDNCPLTRIMEPIVEPLELTPGRGIRGTSLSRAGKPVKKVLLMNLSDHRCSIHTVIIDPHGIRANGDLKVSDARHGISLLTYLRIKLVLNTKLRTNSEIHVSSNANCYGV